MRIAAWEEGGEEDFGIDAWWFNRRPQGDVVNERDAAERRLHRGIERQR